MTFFSWLWLLPFKEKLLIGALIVVVVVGGYIVYLQHRAAGLEGEVKARAEENKRLEDKSEGLRILVNAKTAAAEIENEKRTANRQETNSRVANADYLRERGRDSGESSGDIGEAKRRFCDEFCEDSACAEIRAAGGCGAGRQP